MACVRSVSSRGLHSDHRFVIHCVPFQDCNVFMHVLDILLACPFRLRNYSHAPSISVRVLWLAYENFTAAVNLFFFIRRYCTSDWPQALLMQQMQRSLAPCNCYIKARAAATERETSNTAKERQCCSAFVITGLFPGRKCPAPASCVNIPRNIENRLIVLSFCQDQPPSRPIASFVYIILLIYCFILYSVDRDACRESMPEWLWMLVQIQILSDWLNMIHIPTYLRSRRPAT